MSKKTVHGIDLTAPGGIEALFAFNRARFGDAVMEVEPPAGDPPADPPADPPTPPAATPTGDDEQLGEGGKKALQTEREARKSAEKLATDLGERIKELEDAGKSDDDKRTERFQQLETTEREQAVTITDQQGIIERYRIAAVKGLDLEAAERLRGKTKEELEADADTWIAKWGSSKSPGEVPGAGHRGSDNTNVSPGIARLQQAYSASK